MYASNERRSTHKPSHTNNSRRANNNQRPEQRSVPVQSSVQPTRKPFNHEKKTSSIQPSPSPGQPSKNNSHQVKRQPSATEPHGTACQTCSYCGRTGHLEAVCFKKARDLKEVDTDLLELEFPDIDINDFDFFMMETETSNSPNVVILDTGAQLSVFNNRELLRAKPPLILMESTRRHLESRRTPSDTCPVSTRLISIIHRK